ncbi:hypothetical protein UFOVP567_32 [uncultured Caudovirales phage]|uniref:Uncharacterized protein n=1 Tax=uncultured Caudovirales phage TaxID=2100421 RepID=A0A6J5MVR9_9CAUD|nr:hypothetical protein UFOVP567_32 [uncultured Caudovirales phage]
MSILPPLPYSPALFRSSPDSVTIFYRWNLAAREELRAALNSTGATDFAGWLDAIEGPLALLIDRIEVRPSGEDLQVHRIPADKVERRQWFENNLPSRLVGEVCGAIVAGAYDSELVGKS